MLRLANRLSNDRLYVQFDQYDLDIGNNTHYYMEKAVNAAEKVLIILTPDYKKRADTRKNGVGYKYFLINFKLFENIPTNNRYLPILSNGEISMSVLNFMMQFLICDMRNDNEFELKYKELLAVITGSKITKRPE